MNFSFSILHSTNRPERYRAVFDAWLRAADHPELVQYVLVVDRGGPFALLPLLRPQDVVEWNHGPKNFVAGYNRAASLATGSILIVVADDIFPAQSWDTFLSLYRHQFGFSELPNQELALWAATGTPQEFERNIVVMPIVSRNRVERLGYLFYPAYESMYADNDFCEHAAKDGILVKLPEHVVFPHRHPLFDSSTPWDETYEQQNAAERYSRGLLVLEARRACGFGPIDANKLPQPQPERRKTIAVCLPGSNFSSAWVAEWTGLYSELLAQFNVVPIFLQCSDVHVARNCLTLEIERTRPDLVLWIDDDNPATWPQVAQLVEDLEFNPTVDLVAGWAWCQPDDVSAEGKLSVGVVPSEGDPDSLEFYKGVHALDYVEMMTAPEDMQPIGFTGFPLVLMRAHLPQRLGRNPFVGIPTEHHPFGAWPEDVSFGIRAAQAGCNFAVDRRVHVNHLKRRVALPSNFGQLQAAVEQKNAEQKNEAQKQESQREPELVLAR